MFLIYSLPPHFLPDVFQIGLKVYFHQLFSIELGLVNAGGGDGAGEGVGGGVMKVGRVKPSCNDLG